MIIKIKEWFSEDVDFSSKTVRIFCILMISIFIISIVYFFVHWQDFLNVIKDIIESRTIK